MLDPVSAEISSTESMSNTTPDESKQTKKIKSTLEVSPCLSLAIKVENKYRFSTSMFEDESAKESL